MLVENIGRGAIGMFFLLFVCYLLSTNRKAINWKLILIGVLAQVMFAMGVLHTTVFGQPVFWLLLGVVLIYTIARKFLQVRNGKSLVAYNGINLLLSLAWQALFIFGIILTHKIFGPWSNLAMAISAFAILILAFRMGAKYPELLKWNILFSFIVLTVCVYTKVCPPDIFRIILQAASSVFVDLINVSHRGTEFLFGNLADASQSWAYVFSSQPFLLYYFTSAFFKKLFLYLPTCLINFLYLVQKVCLPPQTFFWDKQKPL
jgi:CNT family concentrative nucleoside transporter